jgi:hypothetical protein
LIGFQFLGFLAGGDPHNLDGVADHVGGPLLASVSVRHFHASVCCHEGQSANGSCAEISGVSATFALASTSTT